MLVPAVFLHVMTGTAYVAVAVLCAVDGWRLRNGSRAAVIPFSVVLGLVMLTSGIQHLGYANHLGDVGRVSFADLATVAMTVPPAAVWAYLRVERLRDDSPTRGDRTIQDHPQWIRNSVTAFVITGASLVGFSFGRAREAAQPSHTAILHLEPWWRYVPQLVTAAAFAYVAIRLWIEARNAYGRRHYWSLSGLALSAVFATGANQHIVQSLNVIRGFTESSGLILAVEWVTAATAVAWAVLVQRTARSSS